MVPTCDLAFQLKDSEFGTGEFFCFKMILLTSLFPRQNQRIDPEGRGGRVSQAGACKRHLFQRQMARTV